MPSSGLARAEDRKTTGRREEGVAALARRKTDLPNEHRPRTFRKDGRDTRSRDCPFRPNPSARTGAKRARRGFCLVAKAATRPRLPLPPDSGHVGWIGQLVGIWCIPAAPPSRNRSARSRSRAPRAARPHPKRRSERVARLDRLIDSPKGRSRRPTGALLETRRHIGNGPERQQRGGGWFRRRYRSLPQPCS